MADEFTLVVHAEQLTNYLENKRERLIDSIAETMDVVNQMMADHVRDNLSGGVLQSKSGALLESVMQTPAQLDGEEVYGSVQAGGDSAPYGIYFEEGGSSYYDIVPVNARVLAFLGSTGMVFASIVHHPPTPKLPWFAPEVETSTTDMKTQLDAVFGEVFGHE